MQTSVVEACDKPVFKVPAPVVKPEAVDTVCVPEPQLADELPGLVRKLGELQSMKGMLQAEIDFLYNLKAANPDLTSVCDQRLNKKGLELVPPRNAWSRGAPSFTSGAHYTGQTFKRINVVRFKYIGPKEVLPQCRYVVRELLCRQMGFVPREILAVSNLQDGQGYDVSFKLMSDLDRFWADYPKFRDTEDWNKFLLVPISRPDTVTVNVTFWNEAVPPQDIEVWLRRHCDLVSGLSKVRDEDGIWTMGWKVLVKLRQYNNITAHLPNSFFIGREKGRCYYPEQPRKCFKCAKTGHLANACTVVKCSLCGEIGHVAADCRDVRCNLCASVSDDWTISPNKRKKKDTSSRRPEAACDRASKKVQSSVGVMVVSNKYGALSHDDDDFERELGTLECDRDIEEHPPPKRKPLSVDPQVESAMDTGGGQNVPDSG
ncbi:LOW QUALITY PROTEIN: uncharacterized protein ACNLHF_028180 [Anomaloglossus baeobatrachus]